jgi:PAS domain S-box-containing protein
MRCMTARSDSMWPGDTMSQFSLPPKSFMPTRDRKDRESNPLPHALDQGPPFLQRLPVERRVRASLQKMVRGVLLACVLSGVSTVAWGQGPSKAGLISSSGGSASTPKEVKRVLVLYAEDKGLPAHELTDEAMRAAFKTSKIFAIELFTEYLNLSRFGDARYKKTLAQFLGDKYSGIRPDLIIAVAAPAVDYILKYGDRIFPGIPIVVSTFFPSQRWELGKTGIGHRVTGVILKEDIGDIITIARTLKPGTRRIALVGGASESDQIYLTIARDALRQQEPETEVIELAGLAMPQILERVSRLPSDSIVLYLTVWVDGAGQRFVPREALSMVSRAANVPIFGLFDSYLGYGIVGGRLLSFEAQGKRVVELALRILAGESPADIPLTSQGTHALLFDWREVKRWGIPEERLPPGSTVRFRELSVWEGHKWGIMGILGVCVLQALLIGGLCVSRWRRREAEGQLRASESRYRTVADYTFDWEYWSAPDGNLNYISPACERITGYPPQRFVENPALLRDIIVSEDRPIWDMHDHAEQTESKRHEIQFRIRARTGETRWIEHRCQRLIDPQGQFSGIRACNEDITRRKEIEERVQTSERDLRALTRKLILAQEAERRRLARELHDDVTQRLAAVAIEAGKLEQEIGEGPVVIRKTLGDMRDQVVRISGDIHRISRQLHPSILDDLGLEKAVASECTRFSNREGIDLVCTVENLPETLPKDVSLSLYRIIQESLTNIAKHACASHASVSLKGSDHSLVLSIQDDGIGFDTATTRRKPGLGLASMRERVSIIHGKLCITSEPKKGTAVEVKIPLELEEEPIGRLP